MTKKENLPEELYGVLNCLCELEEGASAGELCKRLHVVPGRMADILKRLEEKELIERSRNESDRRVVRTLITEKGRQVSKEKRALIHEEYRGLFRKLGENDVRELIRLLRIVLAYYPEQNE